MSINEIRGVVHDTSTSEAGLGNAHSAQEELSFPQIINGISALVSCLTPDGAVETVNRHVLDYFGKTLEELKEWTSTDAVHPDDRPGAIDLWRQSVDRGEQYDMEIRQRGADGAYRWFHVQGLPIRDTEGRIVRWCILQTDIDERKRAQEAVRVRERELRDVIDSIPGFVCTLSARGEVELLNRQLLEYFGKTPEELKDWDSTDAVHPDDLPGVIEAWRRSIETGQPYFREFRQRRADGVYRWFQSRAHPARDTTGTITGWYMLVTDIDDRVRAEEAVRESERELRDLVDNVPGMIAVAAADGRSEYVNKRAIEYLDTNDEGFSERPMATVHPEDQESLRNEWQRCNARGEPMDFAHRVRRSDGVYRWVHVRGEPLRDEQGRIVRWYYVFTDIDEQRKAEEALRESERELRQLIDRVPGMISVADPTGRLDYANQRLLDYTGKTLEELNGFDGVRLTHPDEQEMVKNEWLRCLALGQPYEIDHRLKRFDGAYRWVHVRIHPLTDNRGRIVRWYGLTTDIDDQRRAEEAQRQSEHHLRLLVETIPALVSRITADGRLDYVNRRVVDFIGQEEGLLGMRVDRLESRVAHAHAENREARARKWSHALKTAEPWEDTYRLRRADGEYRWFYERSEPLLDPDGRVVCWYTVSFDINDSREMEEVLRTTRRKLSAAMQVATVAELSASIAHEINQPLASVVTNAHAAETWLAHDPPNLERARATLERIVRDGHSAAEVVRRIRALFKEAAPVKAPLDLNQILAEVLHVLADELRDGSIVLETDLAADLPMIEADHVQIQQTLINIVHNAIESMDGVPEQGRSLLLTSRREGEELLMQVRDHGVGTEEPTLIFDPFFTTKGAGMGMGLSICRSIVEAHGGRIWATANDDAGMTFSFTLPIASAERHGEPY